MVVRTITQPIKNLVEKAEYIAAGNYSTRATVEGTTEIATLSGKFNEMIDKLKLIIMNWKIK